MPSMPYAITPTFGKYASGPRWRAIFCPPAGGGKGEAESENRAQDPAPFPEKCSLLEQGTLFYKPRTIEAKPRRRRKANNFEISGDPRRPKGGELGK